MTYAIRRDNGDVLYFDAISDIEEVYTAYITKHPLSSGSFISDHTIVDNHRFQLRAVLSDADFNLNRPSEEGWVSVTDKQYVNNTETTIPVKITNEGAKWRSFLPEVVAQFTSSTIPTVTVTPQSKVKTAHAVRFDLINMFEKKESFTLVEYNTNLVSRSWANVSMTHLSFAEDADSGEGLFPVIQMEQAVYTDVQNVAIRLRTVPNKGRKNGTIIKSTTEPGDDAATQPTNDSKKTSSAKTIRNEIIPGRTSNNANFGVTPS